MNHINNILIVLTILCSFVQLKCQNNNDLVVNLLQYHVPLEVILPEIARVEHDEYSLTLVLSPDVKIEILQYHKVDWEFDESTKYWTIQSLIEKEKAEKQDDKINIIEERDNMVIAKIEGPWSLFRPYWVAFFVESDESIYQFYSYPQNLKEIEKIKKVLSTIRYIDPCQNKPLKINHNDTIIDFSEFKYPVQISFPSNSPIKIEKISGFMGGIVVVPTELNYRISLDQLVFGNNLEEHIIEKKEELKLESEFLSLVRDEPQGYLVELEEDWTGLLFKIYYFYRSDEYYYEFEIYYRANDDSNASKEEHLGEALKLYDRFKGASVSRSCE